MRKVILCLLVLSMATLTACGNGQTPPAAASVQVKSALNTVKVLQDDDISLLDDAMLAFEAAKGETEGAQIVLRSDGDTAYDVTAGDLIGPSGAKILASAITLYVLKYVTLSGGYTGAPAGAYPDAMIPWDYVKVTGENKLQKDKNQGLWADIAVPRDAVAGDYTGTVKIEAGANIFSVPVTLTVFDFSLPEVPTVPTTYLIWQDWLIDGELDNSVEKYRDYYDFLLRYNITAYRFPAEPGDVDGFIADLRTYYGKVASYGIPCVETTATVDGKIVPSVNFTVLESYLTAIAEASNADETDYFDKAYYYFDKVYDEVDAARYPQMRAVIAGSCAAEEWTAAKFPAYAQSIRGIQHIIPVVTGYTQEFAGYKEKVRLCPLFNEFASTEKLEMYARLQSQGFTFSSYGAAAFWPYGSRLIDDYMLTARDNFWTKFDYRLQGDLYWNVNAYCNYGTVLSVGYGRVSEFYEHSLRDGLTAGDGYLLYPGRMYESQYPFPSLRLTALRDGIDDHAYLTVLEEELLKSAEAYGMDQNKVHEAVGALNTRVYATGISKLNFEGLQEVRRTVARLIEWTRGEQKFALTDFGVDETGVRYTVAAASNAELKVNGSAAAQATPSGGGTCLSAQNAAYPQDGYITVSLGEQTLRLYTGKEYVALIDLAQQENAQRYYVSTQNGSSLVYDAQSHAEHGATVKAVLQGKIFESEAQTKSYRPWVQFDAEMLGQTEELSFWIYNEGEALSVSVVARSETGMQYTVDSVSLPANDWRKITVANFKYISRDPDTLNRISRMGITCENLLDGNEERTHTFYIASVHCKVK